MSEIYDVIIIGGGPAAISAAIYTYRFGLNSLLIAEKIGGQIVYSFSVENYPGILPISGESLSNMLWTHLEKTGVPSKISKVTRVWQDNNGLFVVETRKKYFSRALIVASGREHKKLEVPGAAEYEGKGVHYCVICDGPIYTGKETAVVGGGNSALNAALHLLRISSRIHMINIDDRYKGDVFRLKVIESSENVVFHKKARVTEIFGDRDKMTGLKYIDENGNTNVLPVEAVFVEIGTVPITNFIELNVAKNTSGEIIVNDRCETNIPGLFAAGDVTNVPYKQAIIAAGEGAKAGISAYEYIQKQKKKG
ncbi:MAG: FAD-dependent oxidoreductase [Candidatus Korarchaeota archaeon]